MSACRWSHTFFDADGQAAVRSRCHVMLTMMLLSHACDGAAEYCIEDPESCW
jgi:hypothetical protein